MSIVVLAGGTGGAKFARGMVDVVGPSEVTVIANTGDDIEIHDAYVSPDPDLILFWLADRIDARGWGLEGDTFAAMDALREQGEDVWFALGDQDLAICRERLRRLESGERLTEAIDALRQQLGVETKVLPMCDEPVRTLVDDFPFQEWMIREGAKYGDVDPQDIDFDGVDDASMTPEVTAALEAAELVVIGPSNPAISISPILAVPGMLEALKRPPVVAVSPIVGGEVLKGPTATCLRAMGVSADNAGVAEFYGGDLDGFVADEEVAEPQLVTDVRMDGAAGRARLAQETLVFGLGLA